MTAKAPNEINWLALESNPDVLNKYIGSLGVSGKWAWCDVFGTDTDLLAMVPRPTKAVVLLFPITDVTHKEDEKELERIKNEGQIVSPKLWFMKQEIGNACGTIAVLHVLANTEEYLGLEDGSPMQDFLNRTRKMTPEQRAQELVASPRIAEAHVQTAQQGQTETPELDAQINLHFLAFVEKEGHLYELDGRKPFPVNHGTTDPDSLLEDSVKVIQRFMTRDPTQVNFSIIAFSSAE